MDVATYLSYIEREAEAFVAAAEGKLAHDVPSCPGWNVARLADHVWGVLDFWPHVVENRIQDPSRLGNKPDRPPESEVLDGIRAAKQHALDVLRDVDPATPIWTWSINKTVSFVHRRIPNELSIHRWDAENAGGGAEAIATELASDGVDEFINIFVASGWMRLDLDEPGEGETVEFEQTDGHGNWKVSLDGNSGVVGGKEEPDAVVRGTASDLILLMWRRVGTGAVEIEGDRSVLDRFLSWKEPG